MSPDTAIVTGGARGLGRAIAEALHGRHARILIADREAALGEATARELGEGVVFRPLDIADPEAITGFFATAAAEGPIGALVNNAGVTTPTPLLETPPEAWDSVLDVNLRGSFLCAQAYARHAIAGGWRGAIVNLASATGLSARSGAAAYSASKAGIIMLTRTLAMELGPHGIRVNAVAPGMIGLPHKPVRPIYDSAYLAMTPLGRLGTPPEVASVVRFLLSEDAAFVTGVTIPVDGGFLAGRALPPATG